MPEKRPERMSATKRECPPYMLVNIYTMGFSHDMTIDSKNLPSFPELTAFYSEDEHVTIAN